MTQYFFHVHECGTVTEDRQGKILIDLASAFQVAIRKAWSTMAHEVANGKLCLACHIEIENRETGERTRVPFRETLRLQGI
ncbi:hypothetical protein U1839_03665 [Sphingomonas sp. RT2P30]|uniref:DUF6894 family protein n=1 Tax=Parasphingomonas halimpatiens TaxID=3096162 RepID=UPI002FC8BCDE